MKPVFDLLLLRQDMSDYVPSPTFSDRVKKRRCVDSRDEEAAEKKSEKPVVVRPSGPPFPDVVRTHRLPLVLKSRRGDSLQVYLRSSGRKDENGQLVYDIEFDDGTLKLGVPRSALTAPASTSYQIMILQRSDTQNSVATPIRQRKRR